MTDLDRRLDVRNLAELTPERLRGLGELQVSERQEFLGGSFAESMEAWRDVPRDQVLGYCFLERDRPVGMTLFRRPPASPAFVPEGAASVHGLKIATAWQGRGRGHEGFRLAVARLKTDWPDVRDLVLAVDADNLAALEVYRRFGMVDIGPVFEGNHGPEHRLRISLRP